MRRDAMTNRRRHRGIAKRHNFGSACAEPLCTFTAWPRRYTPNRGANSLSTSIMIISALITLGADSRDASSTKQCFDDAVTNAVRALMPLQRTQVCHCLSDSSLPPRAIFARVCR